MIEAAGTQPVLGVTGPLAAKPAGAEASSGDFTALLGQMLENATESLRHSEGTAKAALSGKATTQQVVEEIMKAERALNTAIAVRDKAVSAYLELSRMAI